MRLIIATALLASAVIALPPAAAGLVVINVPADYGTIQEAIAAAVSGDEIAVAPGTYTEFLDFLGKDIVVRSSAGPEVTTIEQQSGSTPTVTMHSGEPVTAALIGFTLAAEEDPTSGYAVSIEDSAGTVTDNHVIGIRGLRVLNSAVVAERNLFTNVDRHAIAAEDSDAVINRNAVRGIFTNDWAIVVTGDQRPDASVSITENSVHGTNARVLYSVGLDSVVIRGNEFTANDGGAIIQGVSPIVENNVFALNGLTSNSTDSRNEIEFRGTSGGRFVNNTVIGEDNASRKFWFQGPASTIVSNNIFLGPVKRGLVDCSPNITMRANTVWNTKARAFVQGCAVIGQNANKSYNPKFVYKDGFDFRLLPSSAAIDDARPGDAPAVDGDGNPRPLDGDGDGEARADRGAFEYTTSTIRGAVTSAGYPRPHICVAAHPTAGGSPTTTRTKPNGTYRLTVRPDDFKLYFEDCVDGLLKPEWFDDAPTPDLATTITIDTGEDLLDTDADLEPDLMCNGEQVTIVGTPGDDVIVGTAGDDVIATLEGDDNIKAGKGNDVVCAGDGRDTINGGPGTDLLYGEELRDIFKGSKGLDVIDGGPDDEINALDLSASPKAVTVKLNKNKVFEWGGRHLVNIVEVIGSQFDDTMIGSAYGDILRGGPGNDWIDPRQGEDRAYGNDGHDTLLIGGPTEYSRELLGGAGDDLFIAKDVDTVVMVDGNEGVDAIVFDQPEGPIQVEPRTIRFGRLYIDIDSIDIIEGTPFDDDVNLGSFHEADDQFFIFTGPGDDVLQGAGNDQYLDGGVGDDTLISHAAYQILVGGIGDDHLESLRDGALMAPGPGFNTVVGSSDPDDAVTVELQTSPATINLKFGILTWDQGSASLEQIDHAVGTEQNDTIMGNNGENILIGLGGADTIRGSDGDDVLDGNEGSDFLNGGNGNDFCFNGESHQSCEEIADLSRMALAPTALIDTVQHPLIADLLAHHLAPGFATWDRGLR